MDRTVHSVIAVIRDEQQRILESLGEFPKPDPFEHGMQVGTYRGLQQASLLIKSVLDDQQESDSNL